MRILALRVVLNIIIPIGLGAGLLACNGAGTTNSNSSAQNSNLSSGTNKTLTSATKPGSEYAYIVDIKNNLVRMNKVESAGKLVEFGAAAIGSGNAYITISANKRFAYIPSSNTSIIKVFSISESTGMLTLIQDAKTDYPGSEKIVFTPDNKYAYATSLYCSSDTHMVDNCINEFKVDPKTGKLTYVKNVKANVSGAINGLIAIDNSGKYVYISSSNFSPSNAVELFKIEPDSGHLTAGGFYPADNGAGGWSLNVSSDNILYATFSAKDYYAKNGLQNVYAYGINPDTGGLAKISAMDGGYTPTSIVSTDTSKFVYFTSLVSPLNIYQTAVADNGSLTPLSPAMLPCNNIATLRLNTLNNKLYGLDYNHGTYYTYAINASGQLTKALGPIAINNTSAYPNDIAFVRKLTKPVMLEPPLGSRTDVSESTNIVIEFPLDVDPATINANTVQIIEYTNDKTATKGSQVQSAIPIVYAVTLAYGAYTGYLMAKLDPDKDLKNDAIVRLKTHALKQKDGSLLKDSTFTFHTKKKLDNTAVVMPQVKTNVFLNQPIVIDWPSNIQKNTVKVVITKLPEEIEMTTYNTNFATNTTTSTTSSAGTPLQSDTQYRINASGNNEAGVTVATVFEMRTLNTQDLKIFLHKGKNFNPQGINGLMNTNHTLGVKSADLLCNSDPEHMAYYVEGRHFKALLAYNHVVNDYRNRNRYACLSVNGIRSCDSAHQYDWPIVHYGVYKNDNDVLVATADEYGLFPDQLNAPINTDQEQYLAWTGMSANYTPYANTSDSSCIGWIRDFSNLRAAIGNPSALNMAEVNHDITAGYTGFKECSQRLTIYCAQTGELIKGSILPG